MASSASSSCSTRLRATNALRSRSMPVAAGGVGDQELAERRHRGAGRGAEAGRVDGDVAPGRGRRGPRRRRSSRSRPAPSRRRRRRRAGRPCRRRRRRPAAGRRRSSRKTPRRKRSGIWTRIPAPSPVSGSAPVAPRCSRLVSAQQARCAPARGWHALDVGDERDPARVVLESRVVETRGPGGVCIVLLIHESRGRLWWTPGTTLSRDGPLSVEGGISGNERCIRCQPATLVRCVKGDGGRST